MTTELGTSQASDAKQQQQSAEQQVAKTGSNSELAVPAAVESILNDANIKFPLENSWSFWFYKNDKTKDWKENVKCVTTVEFIEDFWGVYNHLQLASKLNNGCDYMFFKKDIYPKWEDEQNSDGGRWMLVLDKKHHIHIDMYWLNSVSLPH